MFELYHDLPTTIEYQNTIYHLKLSYDNVLKCLAIKDDTNIHDSLRMPWIAEALICNASAISIQVQTTIIQAVFAEYIFFNKRSAYSQSNTKSFDFKLDADLIYSSFMQAYNIDLIEQQGKLHWWKFYTLFQGLPKDTKIKEVMEIRQRPIPTPTKYNQEEINALRNAKQFYALACADTHKTYQESLQDVWVVLERQVK